MANGVLHYREGQRHPDPNLVIELSRADFIGLFGGDVGVMDMLGQGRLDLSGNPLALVTFARVSPWLIRQEGDEGYLCVVMPMRV